MTQTTTNNSVREGNVHSTCDDQDPRACSCWTLNRRSASFGVAILWIVGLAFEAFAQTTPVPKKAIEIEQASFQPTVQAGRPMPTWWDVRVNGSAIVEGRFEFILKNDDKLLTTYTTEELALTGPQQTIRIILPPVDDAVIGIDQLQLQVTFRGKRFTEKLQPQVLRMAISRSKSFMALTGQSRLAARKSALRDQIRKRLAFESMVPPAHEDEVKTIFAPIEPERFPSEPITYCAYDLVVLFGDEFRVLKKPQLEALASWIRAGGCLFVEPSGVLEPYQVDFLRGLVRSDSRSIVIQPDSSGRLVPGSLLDNDSIFTVRPDLGCVAIHVEGERSGDTIPEVELNSSQWRRCVAQLWRMKQEQVDAVVAEGWLNEDIIAVKTFGSLIDANGDGIPDVINGGLPGMPAPAPPIVRGGNVAVQAQPTRRSMPQGWLSWTLTTSTGELLDRLMPDGVRMVPLWLLGTILASFVLLIGPVDYFGLGWLKARKYTWLTFPLATIAVTALTVMVTNSYMSTAEARRGLVVCDVGDDGSIVRTNRFELVFIASSRQVSTDVEKGLFTALGTGGQMASNSVVIQQQMMMMRQQGGNVVFAGGMGEGSQLRDASSPRLAGRVPTQYEAIQDLAKWTPQLNRLFWLPGAQDEKTVDWKAIISSGVTRESFTSHVVPFSIQTSVRENFGDSAMVAFFGPNGSWAQSNGTLWYKPSNGVPQGFVYPNYNFNPMGIQPGYEVPAEIQQKGPLFKWIYQHSVAASRGMHSVVSMIAPRGCSRLDDLPVHDSTDISHALLVVVCPRGDDLIVYRKRVPIL